MDKMNIGLRLSLSVVVIIISISSMNAQITIGSAFEPDSDALLDLKQFENGEAEKGLVLPRVQLVAEEKAQPLNEHVEGMLIYNMTDNDNVKPGVYYNDGYKWVRIDSPFGGRVGQTLSMSNRREPEWVTMDIPEISNDNFVLDQSFMHLRGIGVDLTKDIGMGACKEGTSITSGWNFIGESIKITPKHVSNKLIITMQTIVQKKPNSKNDSGWVTYAGGIFVNNRLNSANVDQMAYNNSGSFEFESMMLYMVVENLPLKEQTIGVAVARLTSNSTADNGTISIGKPVKGATNLNDFMAKPSISYLYYENPTSATKQ